MTVTGLRLGAPGVYVAPAEPPAAFVPVRLDIAGFVGAAPRGPVDTPVAVGSWTEYEWLFGLADAPPGGLGVAVHSFFAQGGVRALVLRVSPLPRRPAPEAEAAVARHRLPLPTTSVTTRPSPELLLEARSEGTWGAALTVTWELQALQSFRTGVGGAQVAVPAGAAVPVGSLLRLWLDGGRRPVFGWVEGLGSRDEGPGRRPPVALLDVPLDGVPLPAPGDDWAQTVTVDVVTVRVTVVDGSTDLLRREQFDRLGLSIAHPRPVVRVLADESRLVRPTGEWPDRLVPPDPFLGSATSESISDGVDRWYGISRASFLGDELPELLPVGGLPDDGDGDGTARLALHGVERMSVEPEIGLLCVPDLLWDVVVTPVFAERTRRPSYPEFRACEPSPPVMEYVGPGPSAVLLEGGGRSLDEALDRQRRVVDLADRPRRFVALLDVPDGLRTRDVAHWRSALSSSYAAAYHPWLGTVPEGRERPGGAPLRRLAPSAVAAGIVAARERRLGLPWGPAAEIAIDAVQVARNLGDAEHAELFELDVNVYRAERDGFRLSSARTLSPDPDYAQLSVRRLVTMLRLTLERQGQRLAFEPNTPALRRELTWQVTALLRDLYREGAFAGASEEESFFVHCDDSLNPPWSQEQGRLVAEIGVAPASPLEFIVLRLARDASGTVGVEG